MIGEEGPTTWAETAEPLTMSVGCGGHRHRLRWSAGRLEAVDHPELDAELALVALGGEEPACVALHRLWHEAVADGGFVAEWIDPSHLGPARLSWLAMALERMRTEGYHEFLRHLPAPRARRMGEFLHHFPLSWIDRAGAEVNRLAVAADPTGGGEHGPQLRQAGAVRLRRAFVDAVGGRQLAVGTAALIPLTPLVVSDPDVRPGVGGRLAGPGRGITITVGPRWLHEVWAPGAAVIDGRLVLALDRSVHPGRATLVEWPGGVAGRPVTVDRPVAHDGRHWSLR